MQKSNLEVNFVNTIREYEAIIFKVASFYANHEQPIGDLYQEVVLNLWKAYPSFRGDSKISTWIYRIALNTCITFFRRSKRNLMYVDAIPDIPDITEPTEDIAILYKMIDKLGKIERALILLYLEEKSYKEISEITGLTVTNVATKISRIKDKLKNISVEFY